MLQYVEFAPGQPRPKPTDTTFRIRAVRGNTRRAVTLKMGAVYEVNPLNPQATQNRGRTGTLVAFDWDGDDAYWVHLQLPDKTKPSKIAAADVVPTDGSAVIYERPTISYNQKYREACRFTAPQSVRNELWEEQDLFSRIVVGLVIHDPQALENDPQGRVRDLWRHEGGIRFDGTDVTFQGDGVTFKTTMIPLERQNPIYPLITARVINTLCRTYAGKPGASVRERLLAATQELLDPSWSMDDFLETIRPYFCDYWRGFFHDAVPPQNVISLN